MTLGKNMKKFFKYDHVLPSYGELKTIEGDFVSAKPYGMDIWDYVWGLSLPPFEISDFDRYKELREQLREDMTTTKGGYFLCTYFALLNSMDTEIHSEDSIVAAMDMLVDYSSQPGKYLPMPNAMPEMFNISEENPYHDVRPLVYSIAPWLASVTNLGIHRTPFGIAVRGSDYLESIDNYEYKGAYIDVSFEGSGETAGFKLNDILYKRTMQIPEENLKPGENKIVVIKSGKGSKNTLISSTVQLKSMTSNQNKTTYNIQAYGKNVLTFKKLDKKAAIKDASGKKVKYKKTAMDNLTYIEFEGRGNYELSLE
jgi:hypothetical protein